MRGFPQQIAIIYLAVAVCFVGVHGAHVHLSEMHAGGESHRHDAEFHVTHQTHHHDDIAGSAEHLTDAASIELDQTGTLAPDSDDPAPFAFALALVLFLLAVPVMPAARGRRLRERVFRIPIRPNARPGARGPP